MIVDPPRRGLSASVRDQLANYAPARLVYVSCDPATRARDAKALVASGAFVADRATPFDMFPMTKHTEAVLVFTRAPPGDS